MPAETEVLTGSVRQCLAVKAVARGTMFFSHLELALVWLPSKLGWKCTESCYGTVNNYYR